MGVEFVTLKAVPVPRTTEYLATVKSRRSTNLQPMVDGIITRIEVRSGARVDAGDLVLEIENSQQRAAVAGLESIRAAREADLQYAKQEAARQQSLFEAGAASEKDAQQAQTALETARASLRAAEEQLQEQKVRLGYYRVTAPTAGIVGDVPVRVGDRVTAATVLTTIDTGGGLELYVYVPVRESSGLRSGLPVDVVDDDGNVLVSTSLDFVSPQVEEETQSVLAKASLPEDAGFRTEQQVRTRLIWREEPTLTIPVVSVRRVNGVHFAFLVDDSGGQPVARERAVRVGVIVGNDYVVQSGVEAGEKLIVSGIQKIRDGAPVNPMPRDAAKQS
jgi:RND family efflux transporter MFP subunit